MSEDIVTRFHRALPQIREWIDKLLQANAPKAHKIDASPPLILAFPPEVFERTRMVLVDRTPYPPVSQFGLPEFAQQEKSSVRRHNIQEHLLCGRRARQTSSPIS